MKDEPNFIVHPVVRYSLNTDLRYDEYELSITQSGNTVTLSKVQLDKIPELIKRMLEKRYAYVEMPEKSPSKGKPKSVD